MTISQVAVRQVEESVVLQSSLAERGRVECGNSRTSSIARVVAQLDLAFDAGRHGSYVALIRYDSPERVGVATRLLKIMTFCVLPSPPGIRSDFIASRRRMA